MLSSLFRRVRSSRAFFQARTLGGRAGRLAGGRLTSVGYAGARRRRAAHLVLWRGPVLDELDDPVRTDPPCRQGEHAHQPGHADVDDSEEVLAAAMEVGVERRLGRSTEEVVRRATVERHHRRLDDTEQAEVDRVGTRHDLEGGGVRQAGVLLTPVAEKRVPAGDPEHRGDADVLEAGRQSQRRVEARADQAIEDVARRADLLAVAPARRRGGVVELKVVGGLEDRLDDRVDPLLPDVLDL